LPDALGLAQAAQQLAGRDAFAHVTSERSLMMRFAANRPTQSTAVDDVTVEIAVPHRGHVGRASTNAADPDSLRACAERALAAARAAAASGEGGFPGFSPTADAQIAGDDRLELDPAAGGAALTATFAAADAARVEAHGVWTLAEEERAWATSGAGAAERTTDAFMKVICMAESGRSGYAATTARDAGALDGHALAEQAAKKATMRSEPAELAPGAYPVVFEPHAVGTLLEMLAASAFDGRAHADGRGALSERLGEPLTAPSIELADLPDSRLTLARSFDAEGTAKEPLTLIEGGVARRVAHDLRSAALAGERTTGHALAPGGHPYGVLPTNLVLAGGDAAEVEDLCAPLERGIYVTRLWYANVIRPKETLVTAVSRDGTFLIEDGRIARPLQDLRLTDRVLGILSRTAALGSRQTLTSDGEFYGRRFAHGVACPPLRAEAVRFTSATGRPVPRPPSPAAGANDGV